MVVMEKKQEEIIIIKEVIGKKCKGRRRKK